MSQHPTMTDPTALARNRKRAKEDALFLHAVVADEVEDRMALVNKPFTSTALVTGFADFWAARFPSAEVVADDETLPLEVGQYDLALNLMGLHWANDPIGQLIQCRRALKPDGLFIGATLGGQTLHELRACLAEAEARVSGGLSPRIAPMGELRDLGGLLQRAGFALPVADSVPLTVTYADSWALMRDLRSMGETNALSHRLRRPTRRAVFEQAAQLYQANFAHGSDRIKATFELVFLTGWAPDESQPKPLRPGSAQQRLADALGAVETKLPD